MTTPRRRWFRFSLRTLFVLIGVCGCVLAWVAGDVTAVIGRRQLGGAGAYEIKTVESLDDIQGAGFMYERRNRSQSGATSLRSMARTVSLGERPIRRHLG